jgi:hypothetical protein
MCRFARYQPKTTEGGGDGAPGISERKFGKEPRHKFGEDVLIGIIDVGGFGFSHPGLLDANGKTRSVAIWDQGGGARPSPGGVQFGYGVEFKREEAENSVEPAVWG